jgi:hypothetical protein
LRDIQVIAKGSAISQVLFDAIPPSLLTTPGLLLFDISKKSGSGYSTCVTWSDTILSRVPNPGLKLEKPNASLISKFLFACIEQEFETVINIKCHSDTYLDMSMPAQRYSRLCECVVGRAPPSPPNSLTRFVDQLSALLEER